MNRDLRHMNQLPLENSSLLSILVEKEFSLDNRRRISAHLKCDVVEVDQRLDIELTQKTSH